MLRFLESSSPSYLLMSSLELAVDIYDKYGQELMNDLLDNINEFNVPKLPHGKANSINELYESLIENSLPKKETIELLTLIYRANSRFDKNEVLQTAREQIEVIRLLIRLMKDMHQISIEKFVQVNQSVENVSKQLTGWQKSLK